MGGVLNLNKKGFALLDVVIGLCFFTLGASILFATLFQYSKIHKTNDEKLQALINVAENIDKNFENNWDLIKGEREDMGGTERITFEGFAIEKRKEPNH